MNQPRNQDPLPPRNTGRRNSVLQRRILGGTVLVVVFFFALWRSWGLDGGLFWQLLAGTAVMIVLMMLAGAVTAWVIGLLRRSRD